MISHENTLAELKKLCNRLQYSVSPKEDYLILKDFTTRLFNSPYTSKIKVLEDLKNKKIALFLNIIKATEDELSNKLNLIFQYIATLDQNDPIVSQVNAILDDDISIEDQQAYLFSKIKRILCCLLNNPHQHLKFVETIANVGLYIEKGGLLQPCQKSTQSDYNKGELHLHTESISPTYNKLHNFRLNEFGEMPPWYCISVLETFHNEATYEPPVNGEPINAAYNYTERCKILSSSFTSKSEDSFRDFKKTKFAAVRIVDYLEAPDPILLISQSDISLEQVARKEKYYLKICDERSKKPFEKNPLVLLRITTKDIYKRLDEQEVYKHLTPGKKKEEKAFFGWQPGEPLDNAQRKCIRDLVKGINERIKEDFRITDFFIYQDGYIYINPLTLK